MSLDPTTALDPALLADWTRLLRPEGAVETALVERLAFTCRRAALIDAVEHRALTALLDPTAAPDPRLPSLDTLCRCRARIDRDRAAILATIQRLRAERIGKAPRTHEPERPTPAPRAPDHHVWATLAKGRQALAESQPPGTNEPEPALNRAERRRLAALERRAA